jgi:glycosyltransferase involved in cell wall biosynthesis
MPEKSHIVLLAKGGSYWQGGRQYTLNLANALVRVRKKSEEFAISVLVNGTEELTQFNALKPYLHICADLADIQQPYTFTNKIRWRFKRTVLGWRIPRLEEALFRLGASFAYPLRSMVIPSADWIPDFQYRHFPEGSNQIEIEGRKREFASIVNEARRVVLSSACSEQDCHNLFPLSISKTIVLRFRAFIDGELLAEDPRSTVGRYNLPERYVMISNQLGPTKNHSVVLEALKAIHATERANIHVVCTGDIYDYRNPGFYNAFLAGIHEAGARNCVSVLGLIPKHDQIQLLRAAAAYLQPSLFEGWNTGVEEAHMLGKPILLSDIPVHREQDPPHAVYFPPHNPAELAHCLREVFASRSQVHDPQREQQAVASYSILQTQFAHQFLKMAEQRHNLHGSTAQTSRIARWA